MTRPSGRACRTLPIALLLALGVAPLALTVEPPRTAAAQAPPGSTTSPSGSQITITCATPGT